LQGQEKKIKIKKTKKLKAQSGYRHWNGISRFILHRVQVQRRRRNVVACSGVREL